MYRRGGGGKVSGEVREKTDKRKIINGGWLFQGKVVRSDKVF